MTKITLDLNKSIEENASNEFDKAKKLKKKLKGAETLLQDLKKKIEREMRLEKEEEKNKLPPRKREWYEKFRWFFTSKGLLVIGGRDATSNEIVIKKHAETGDLVFHTDMAGSPFFVIKKGGGEIDENSINETADATCSFSRAWKLGLTSSNVFYVNPDQVTKEANAGEYLSKGSFMIKGKTTYVDNKINLAVGIKEGAVMVAPEESVSKNCEKIIIIKQGDGKPSDSAKKIRKLIGGELDEIIRTLPSGGIKVMHK